MRLRNARFWLALLLATPAYSQGPRLERTVIDANFPGGYQVEVADVNGDKKPDIIALGGGTCAWYENPSWTKRIVTGPDRTPGIISSAAADLDGDGKAEIAIAYDFEMNTPKRGKLTLAQQAKDIPGAWELTPIADVPSIHRLRWGDLDGDNVLDLVVAPIFAPDATPPLYAGDATVRIFNRKQRGGQTAWDETTGPKLPVLHAIKVIDADGDGRDDLLTASNRGAYIHVMTTFPAESVRDWAWRDTRASVGGLGEAPHVGSSEIHLGRLKDGRRFLATIDPWHGNTVAVCLEELPRSLDFEPRTVLDETLTDGHALWVADVDRDGDDEVLAGHRGKDARVSLYDFDGVRWNRTVIDREITAQDLRGGDLDGDGTPDVVAVGGASKNVVLYRFRPASR